MLKASSDPYSTVSFMCCLQSGPVQLFYSGYIGKVNIEEIKYMIKVAIVEDDDDAAMQLKNCILRFGEENNGKFECTRYKNAVNLLMGYTADYDIIFMDIDLPHMSGMEASEKLREMDKDVVIVFVTNLAHMAIKGYEVNASSFIVKPIIYSDFAMKMGNIIKNFRREKRTIILNCGRSLIRIKISDIYYVETVGHKHIFHTNSGNYSCYGYTLKKLAQNPLFADFALCNSCYLVNLYFVKKVEGYTLTINNEELVISRPKRMELIKALNEYLDKHY